MPNKKSGKSKKKDEDDDLEVEETGLADVVVAEETEPKGRRHKPTMAEHVAHYDTLLSTLDVQIDKLRRERGKGTRALRVVRKVLKQMRKELPHVTRSREARRLCSTRKAGSSGLMMKCDISDELRTFLKLKKGEQLSRVEATRAVCAYAHFKEDEKREGMLRWQYLNPKCKRDLQDPENRKAILPDAALGELLGYEKYKKDVAKGKVTKKIKNRLSGEVTEVKLESKEMYYWTIQRLLKRHFV